MSSYVLKRNLFDKYSWLKFTSLEKLPSHIFLLLLLSPRSNSWHLQHNFSSTYFIDQGNKKRTSYDDTMSSRKFNNWSFDFSFTSLLHRYLYLRNNSKRKLSKGLVIYKQQWVWMKRWFIHVKPFIIERKKRGGISII